MEKTERGEAEERKKRQHDSTKRVSEKKAKIMREREEGRRGRERNKERGKDIEIA